MWTIVISSRSWVLSLFYNCIVQQKSRWLSIHYLLVDGRFTFLRLEVYVLYISKTFYFHNRSFLSSCAVFRDLFSSPFPLLVTF